MPVLRLNACPCPGLPGSAALLPDEAASTTLSVMSRHDDREPLFVYRRFAGGWVLNHRNPLGLAFILALTCGLLLLIITL